MFQNRQFQTDIENAVEASWQAGVKNVGISAPTGSGKTVMFARLMKRQTLPVVGIAHRQELVSQMSLAMAKQEIYHRLIAPDNVIKDIIKLHRTECGGACFYNPDNLNAAAGVDTLKARAANLGEWSAQVGLWAQDEAHHLLKTNKWGLVIDRFVNAKGLGVSATWNRADGKGLGRNSDGIIDHLIYGPTTRDLINAGYLSEYKVICAESDIDLANVEIGTTGDFKPNQLAAASRDSHIVGDVVKSYLKWANGKLGITFASDVETAERITAEYNAAGIPAALVTAKTKLSVRSELMRRFKRRELLQLVNVDLFGEGTDVPALEVVSMARATASYSLYAQQFGRSLRIFDGKFFGMVIDHVGNIIRHNGPPVNRKCTLEGRGKGSRNTTSETPLTSCRNGDCLQPYERFRTSCPYCGAVPEPDGRASPKMVDGRLIELDAATLEAMFKDVAHVDKSVHDFKKAMPNAPDKVVDNAARQHFLRQQAQRELRHQMTLWGGRELAKGLTTPESQKMFYMVFGVDILTAQAMGRGDAVLLTEKIKGELI